MIENGFSRKVRQDHQPPEVIALFGWRFHHIGIPTNTPHRDEVYLPHLKMYVSGFKTSPFGIEWMRFEEDSPVSEIVKTIPHIAYEVDNLDEAVEGKDVLTAPHTLYEGVRVAMIIDDSAPIELLEFHKSKG